MKLLGLSTMFIANFCLSLFPYLCTQNVYFFKNQIVAFLK